MSGLADMEELLGSISNKDIVDYMREALACYGGGAYRGCIVLSYIAMFDDIRLKLGELAKVNGQAKTLWQEVEKRSNDQDVFESYMADQLLKTGLITTADHKQLGLVRDMRNRAAHPSGVHASPEEARYVYRTVIDVFLSRPLLKTTHAVDAVLERLGKANLFPTVTIDDVAAIAQAETASVNEAALPHLVVKLVEAQADPDTDTKRNAGRMLGGLAALKRADLRKLIRAKLIEGKAHDADYGPWIVKAVAGDGALVKDLKPDVVLRIAALLLTAAKVAKLPAVTALGHPVRQFAAVLDALGESAVRKDYAEWVTEMISRFPYNPGLLDALAEAPATRADLIAKWKMAARSGTFDTANAFADALPVLDDYAETFLTDEEALEIVAGVVAAADNNARRSKAVRAQKFSDAPIIAGKAASYAKTKPKSALKLLQKRVSLVESAKGFVRDELEA
jgi:hypothetical protein